MIFDYISWLQTMVNTINFLVNDVTHLASNQVKKAYTSFSSP